jgi:hypothetical protein
LCCFFRFLLCRLDVIVLAQERALTEAILPSMHATDESDYKAVIVKSGWVTTGGEFINIRWKAYCYVQSECVAWELRLLLQDFYSISDLKNWSLKAFLKVNRVPMQRLLGQVGLLWSDEFVPSMKMHVARNGPDAVVPPLIRQEAQLKTSGLILLLVRWGADRHRIDEKALSRAMLAAFLSQFASLENFDREYVWRTVEAMIDNCSSGRMRPDHWCVHLDDDLDSFLEDSVELTWDIFVQMLCALYSAADCEASIHALGEIVVQLVQRVDQGIICQMFDDFDPKDFNELVDRSAKKMRLDEDFRRHVTVDMFRSRATRSTGGALRHWTKVDPSTGRHWERQYVLQNFFANRRLLKFKNVCSICEDGSKQGRPREETLLFFMWDADANLATSSAPQVTWQISEFR